MDLAHYFAAFVILGVKILLYLQNIIKYFRKLFAVDKSFAIFARYSGMGDWIGPLNWTVGLGSYPISSPAGLPYKLSKRDCRKGIAEKGLPKRDCRKGIAEKEKYIPLKTNK
jgi:hypothetical protein